ncbi:cobyrinic acid a,c-diamide synthase [Ectothiorhodospira mobilis]|uniref:cobyrinic acid a,c-diamide synthase n=1 Tax=Ectothiorhodospira mobilis TaxID=195064 RepID=UPI001EE7AD8A|nr:cobyrinic acid a,c-diamide synthase [Ectothiorhodospira mobilis]MCG5536541.1 cobyrinic acid a,c-diamide synthase [Ectothiorhodospira mobilis]
MFPFLQGFAYGLFLSCLPWLILGLMEPRWALPTDPPRRWQVLLRYWLLFPFLALVLWLTSLWGGFGASLGGWVAGLLAISVEIPAERAWRRWRVHRARQRQAARARAAAEQRRAEQEQKAREAGLAVLDPQRPPVDADDLVRALCEAKGRLLQAHRPDLAPQADRLYTRYGHVNRLLDGKFDPRELTHERSRKLVAEVAWSAVDQLNTMASVARGLLGVDPQEVRRRLAQPALADEERRALERRMELVETTEARLRELKARNEAALTALDDAAVTVSALNTQRPRAGVAAEQALEDLRRFVDQAHRYDRSS